MKYVVFKIIKKHFRARITKLLNTFYVTSDKLIKFEIYSPFAFLTIFLWHFSVFKSAAFFIILDFCILSAILVVNEANNNRYEKLVMRINGHNL